MSDIENSAKLFRKIKQVMEKVTYLTKDDQIKFGNTNYKAISEENVVTNVRKALVEVGIVIIPVKIDHKKEGNLSTVDVTYSVCDIDTGYSIEAVSSGTGADTQDKGVGKAMTYAGKYLLLKLFLIPTGEDTDKISSEELDQKMKPSTQQKPSYQQRPAQKYQSPVKQNTPAHVKSEPKTESSGGMAGKLWDMLLEMGGGSEDNARTKLKEYSTFHREDGSILQGVTDVKNLYGARLKANFITVKKDYDKMKDLSNTFQAEVVNDKDIPF
jgi:hypothetical protein